MQFDIKCKLAILEKKLFFFSSYEPYYMPEICRFYGIRIEMFFLDHGVPHFHVRYGEYTAKIAIESLQIIRGVLPRRAYRLATEWAILHRDELMRNWQRTQAGQSAFPIDPLT